MRFYSDKLNSLYNSEDELLQAEKTFDEKERQKEVERKAQSEKRAERAKDVETARKAMIEARKAYAKAVNDFAKEFGSYHTSITSVELPDFLYLF